MIDVDVDPRVPVPGDVVKLLRRRRDFNLVIAVGAGKPLDDISIGVKDVTFSWHITGAQLVRNINGIYCLRVVAWTE